MAAGPAAAVAAQIGANEQPAAIDIREKYNAERDKRLRDDGNKQFISLAESQSDKIRRLLEDPWVEPGTPLNIPVSDGGHVKFLIVGTGYGGILYAVKLIQAGFKVDDLIFVDPAGGFGGTWYWNRYPGLMCDVESYIYMPLLEEMGYMPKRKYAGGEELRIYIESICRKYDLYKKAMFQSAVKKATWNEETKDWDLDLVLKPKGGEESPFKIRADNLFIATGVLHNSKLPDLPGVDTFNGEVFHTSRWRYDVTGGTSANPELTKLKGKKVGIVGTGELLHRA
jgi:cation diffusion facilitator CzcD-associated flavoprotein CzcO